MMATRGISVVDWEHPSGCCMRRALAYSCRRLRSPQRTHSAMADATNPRGFYAMCSSSASNSGGPQPPAADTTSSVVVDKVRRQQSHLQDETVDDDERGGPKTLEQLHLRVLARSPHFVVLNKGADERMDGAFDVTLEKALVRDFPDVDKFRWIHQLDFATSGVLCVGANKAATATACRLFREKRVQKEYLAVVRGHLPFNPAESTDVQGATPKACTFSKLGLLIQDMEEFERLKAQQRGSKAHQKHPDYPRGPRHGPNIFNMEQAKLLRESHGDPRAQVRGNEVGADARELTPAEQQFVKLTWHDLSKEEQAAYTQQAKTDKARFVRELTTFLGAEKARLARKRKYESLGREEERETKHEPVAYVFDAPIVEPHRSTGVFRMQVGDEQSASGKTSTTIAFVLGHGTYNQQPVSKVLLRPLNGRRHQLRLHLAHHGFPIAGDVTYGSQEDDAPRMMLHAWKIWLRARPEEQSKYGDLYFESPDPFETIVKSEREVATITYHKHKQAEAEAKAAMEAKQGQKEI